MNLSRFKKIAATVLARTRHMHSLKYIVVIVAAVVLVGFVDENSLWNHFMNQRRIAVLEAEIAEQLASYERDKKQLQQIGTSVKAVEKIARERYFMKADDEDIFVLSDDIDHTEQEEETTSDERK